MRRALVLAGGGVAGVAWELGVLLGIRDGAAGLASGVVDADLIVGTSAGSTVAAQVAGGTDLAELFDRQLAATSSEIEVEMDIDEFLAKLAEAAAGADSPAEVRRRVGQLALAADTVPEPVRRAAIAGRLLLEEWSDRDVRIPAVDAETGELIVFTRGSGVRLVDAVAASCAVPGVWPPVTIDGHRYIDGGVRSPTNADLAAGCDRILIITPAPAGVDAPLDPLDAEIQALSPGTALVVRADEASVAAFGRNPLSPATRGPAALAGRAVGRSVAAEAGTFWV